MSRAILPSIVVFSALSLAFAADDLGGAERVRLVEPQIAIAIEHVEGQGDLVQVHYSGGYFDEPSLKAAIEELAALTGAKVTSYQFMPGVTTEEVSKAFFVTQNLVDVSSGDVRLQPIVRSFMQGANGKLESFSIRIMGMRPNPYTTLASYSSKAVALKAFYDAATPSLEYRILVLTDESSKVQIPPRYVADDFQTQLPEEPSKSPLPLLIGLIALSGASAGALVYFALLGKRS